MKRHQREDHVFVASRATIDARRRADGAERSVRLRTATAADARALASLNKQLIDDEGHRNPMGVPQLESRMRKFLAGDYEAILFESGRATLGYALFRCEGDAVHLRHFFVSREQRRAGVGRAAFSRLRAHAWADAARITLDVLVTNAAGIAFWRSLGFRDYALAMEWTS